MPATHSLNGTKSAQPTCMEDMTGTWRFGMMIGITPSLITPDVYAWREELAPGTMNLANGANHNVATPTKAFVNATGLTAAGTLTGVFGSAGRKFALFNRNAHVLTVAHESASSAIVNRFTLAGGVDLNIPAGEVRYFEYSSATSRYVPSTFAICDAARYRADKITNPAIITAMDFPMKGTAINPATGVTVYDHHFGLAVGVDSQTRMHVLGNGHADPQHYIYSNNLAGGSWPPVWTAPTNALIRSAAGVASGRNATTYNYFDRTSSGILLCCHDQQDSLTDPRGRDVLGWYLPATATLAWLGMRGAALPEIFRTSTGSSFGAWAERVYITALRVQPAHRDAVTGEAIPERIWFGGIWRTDNNSANSQKQPFLLRLNVSDLGTGTNWQTITGANQPMPISWANGLDNRVPSSYINPPGLPEIHRTVGGFEIDANGQPMQDLQNGGLGGVADDPSTILLVGQRLYDNPLFGPRVLVKWNRTTQAWEMRSLVGNGSAVGGTLCRVDHRAVQIVGQVGGRVIVTSDAGASGTRTRIGGEAGSGFAANFDSVSRQRGRMALMICDGNEPRVFTVGGGYKGNASP